MSSSYPIRLAFVGCGFVAQQTHLPCFSALNSFTITHLADPFIDLRESIASKYSIPHVCDSHFDLIGDESIDAVIVTLPRKLTFQVVQDLVLDSKFVLAEKPICLNSSYGLKLLDSLAGRSSSVMTAYMKQHDLGFIQFRQLVQEIPLTDIVSIRGYCHMGNSYANPFGDIKGSQLVDIQYKEQEFPEWLPKTRHWAFEQFINVFSHITHAIDLLVAPSLDLKHAVLNDDGEGSILLTIDHIPVTLELIRGEQDHWREGIVVTTRTKQISVEFPPAFLRNTPSLVTITDGLNSSSVHTVRPPWSWAFLEQAKAFRSFISHTPVQHNDLHLAVKQVALAEDIFRFSFNL